MSTPPKFTFGHAASLHLFSFSRLRKRRNVSAALWARPRAWFGKRLHFNCRCVCLLESGWTEGQWKRTVESVSGSAQERVVSRQWRAGSLQQPFFSAGIRSTGQPHHQQHHGQECVERQVQRQAESVTGTAQDRRAAQESVRLQEDGVNCGSVAVHRLRTSVSAARYNIREDK